MGEMTEAVEAALAARPTPDPLDGAAAQLARTYAGLMDHAKPGARYVKALSILGCPELHEPEDVAEAFQTVATALAEHSVASDLGPKLAAVLDRLGLTTAARGITKGGGVKDEQPDAIDRIRANRDERRGTHVYR